MTETGLLSRLFNLWQLRRESLWLLPAAISLGYLLLILANYWVELNYLPDLSLSLIVFDGDNSSAGAIATTLLSSMITMATLAISITVVSLSLAASQLGPRLIRTFMADQRTQVFIGLFFGAVIACFALTAVLHHAAPSGFQPKLTISLVFALCFCNLFVLLMFVHHVAQSCIADNVILKVSEEFSSGLARLSEDIAASGSACPPECPEDWPENFREISAPVHLDHGGYIQLIDYSQLAETCRQLDCRMEITVKAGHFVVPGETCLYLTPVTGLDESARKSLADAFQLGTAQTHTQDIQFAIRHLVEIAIRALSPGINDSFTALTVMDHLCEGIATLFHKQTASQWLADSSGTLRIHARQCDTADIVFSAFNQIRECSAGNATVLAHFMDKLVILAELAREPLQQEGINRQWQNLGPMLARLEQSIPRHRELLLQYENISQGTARLSAAEPSGESLASS